MEKDDAAFPGEGDVATPQESASHNELSSGEKKHGSVAVVITTTTTIWCSPVGGQEQRQVSKGGNGNESAPSNTAAP